MKLGINLEAVNGLSDKEYIKTIADLGFKATFTDMTVTQNCEEIAELCAMYGIKYETIHAPLINVNSMWLNKQKGDDVLNIIKNCVDRCSSANVPIIIVHSTSGFFPPDISEIGCNRFTKLVEYAREKNVKIAFENLRVVKHLEWAMKTFWDDETVGFCWDVGHENCFTKNIDFMSLYGEKIICTHIHDNFKIRHLDMHLIPFDGFINFKKVAKTLAKANYSDILMLEVLAEKTGFYKRLTPEEYLKRAYKSAKRLEKLIIKES